MAPSVVVVIREDPSASARPVEALRIALGLGTGENEVTVVLLGQAPKLLSEEEDELLDRDILEKYLPSLKQMGVTLVVPPGAIQGMALDPEFTLREASPSEVAALVASAERTLVF